MERNALTNVGNQVLIFAYMGRRCGKLIHHCFPNLSEEQLTSYYAFAKRIKLSMLNYISMDKLAGVWTRPHPEEELNYRILRTVCLYFIQEQQAVSIVTSQKLLKEAKASHLKARRRLLSLFRQCSAT